jgi:hypothetical protein
LELDQRKAALERKVQRGRDEERQKLLGDFAYFFREAWSWVEPARLLWNWHHQLLCDYLQALQSGKLFRDLIVNIPPGTTKSLCASVIWPAWCFAKNPSERMLFASYDSDIVAGQSSKCRELVLSDWYQEFFGDRVQIDLKANRNDFWHTTEGGFRMSRSYYTSVTGRHPTLIAYDDLNGAGDTKKKLEMANDWNDQNVSSRGLGKTLNRRRLNLQQRIADMDITAHLMKFGTWASLVLPAEYEPGRMRDIGLGTDPRTKDGELLWPEMFGREEMEGQKRTLGENWWGQYQQRPVAPGGRVFKIDRLHYEPIEAVPWDQFTRIKRAWDKASTFGGGCYTAGILMGLVDHGNSKCEIWILDSVRGQWGSDEVEEQLTLYSMLDEKKFGTDKYETVFEQEPGASGVQAARETIRRNRGYRVRAVKATRKKLINYKGLADSVAFREVHVVESEWTSDLVTELQLVPKGEYVDQCDSAALAYNELINPSMFDLPEADERHEVPVEPCKNQLCDRRAIRDDGYCCNCCKQAAGEGESLLAGQHEPICMSQHNTLYAKGEWEPNAEIG